MQKSISKRGKKSCAYCGEPIAIGQVFYLVHKGAKYFATHGKYHATYDFPNCVTLHANEIYVKQYNAKLDQLYEKRM